VSELEYLKGAQNRKSLCAAVSLK